MRPVHTAVGLALVVALAVAVHAPAADRDHHNAYDRCAKACGDCQRACDSCAAHCAKMLAEGHKEHRHTLASCQDCATHCGAAACIVARRGPYSDTICTACAEACARCAKACERFSEDEHMKQCAGECRRCEKACREMLDHVGKKTRKKTKERSERE